MLRRVRRLPVAPDARGGERQFGPFGQTRMPDWTNGHPSVIMAHWVRPFDLG